MPDNKCPYCSSTLDQAYLYVRGLAASLHVSTKADTRLFSRSGLTQVDLEAISEGAAGTQAIISALRCTSCESISFRTRA